MAMAASLPLATSVKAASESATGDTYPRQEVGRVVHSPGIFQSLDIDHEKVCPLALFKASQIRASEDIGSAIGAYLQQFIGGW